MIQKLLQTINFTLIHLQFFCLSKYYPSLNLTPFKISVINVLEDFTRPRYEIIQHTLKIIHNSSGESTAVYFVNKCKLSIPDTPYYIVSTK